MLAEELESWRAGELESWRAGELESWSDAVVNRCRGSEELCQGRRWTFFYTHLIGQDLDLNQNLDIFIVLDLSQEDEFYKRVDFDFFKELDLSPGFDFFQRTRLKSRG